MPLIRVVFVFSLVIVLVAVTGGAPLAFAQDALPAPVGVTAEEVATGQVVVRWDPVPDALFYRVGWVANEDIAKVNAEGREWLDAFVFVDVANLGQTDYAVTRLEPGKLHYFIVASVTARFGQPTWSRWSNRVPLSDDLTACPVAQPAMMPSPGRAALVTLYHATGGANWTDNTSWLSDAPVGDWYGVTANADGRVLEVSLGSNGLVGRIPPELGNLADLTALDLSGNRLTGSIPSELGSLSSLERLYLGGNALTGCIHVPLRAVRENDLSDLGLPDCVVNRDLEYIYSINTNIDTTGEWERDQEREGSYFATSHTGRIRIFSQQLPSTYTLEQFSQLVQSDLPRDWWWWHPGVSMLGAVSTEPAQVGDQPALRLRYWVRENDEYCAVDIEELITVSNVLAGSPQGFRVRVQMCAPHVADHGPTRDRILDSFQVATRPAEYYNQFISVDGVSVKAAEMVDPTAVQGGADIVAAMLSGREDIARCMTRQGASLAIIPKDQWVTTLPEFARLSGQSDFTGRTYDSFDLRGLGATRDQTTSAAAEEHLLSGPVIQHRYLPYRGLVAVHEFAHGIQNICFTQEDHDRWRGFYEDMLDAGLYAGTHMMADIYEFFAVFSTGYFEVTHELGPDSNREDLRTRFPEVFEALDSIYGGSTLPERYLEPLLR